MRPLLSAVLLVKNEAASIKKVIEAAAPWVDRVTVLDSGSADGTQDIVREFGPAVALYEETIEPWDFSVARNRAMQLDAERADAAEFQIVLSGDEYLRGGDKLREHLTAHVGGDVDCHFIRVLVTSDEATSFSPRIFRTGSAWKYEGAIHEVPYNRENPDAPVAYARDCAIEHVVTDLEARYSNIWESHIPNLKAALEESPGDARTLIFLAQSYGSLLPFFQPYEVVTYGMEAMSYLLRRLALEGGIEAERNYCELQYLEIARRTGVYTDEELFARAEALAKKDPDRPDTQVLYAYCASRVRPAPLVYQIASNAAHVAMRAAEEIENSSPVSTTCCWRAHLLAATSAKKIAEKYPADDNGKPWTQIAREHAEAGLAAGGPELAFGAAVRGLEGAGEVMQVEVGA